MNSNPTYLPTPFKLLKTFAGVRNIIKFEKINNNAKIERQFLLPKRTIEGLFPGIETFKSNISISQFFTRHQYMVPIFELLFLGAICKYLKPRKIFEIGTFTGSTTLSVALNTSTKTEIFTLDLHPSKRTKHKRESGIVGKYPDYQSGELFKNTPLSKKITQLFGNSQTFDFRRFYNNIDLVFIDANHRYSFVKNDTKNAFKILRPGGVIIWDDYIWDEHAPWCAGVAQHLHELQKSKPIFRIAQTRFAIYLDK